MLDINMEYYAIWKKALTLAWPIILNHVFVTAMRTTDMLLMGHFGPAAVTAVGLGDVWERIVLHVGLGLGTGSISLISQETGAARAGKEYNANEILTQVLITGALIGLPFIVIGVLIPDKMIQLLGAEREVITTGAQYLMIIFAAAPFRIVTLIAARSLQGTGDTRTPMVVDIVTNVINIVLSVLLSLGLFFFPELGVLGVGIGTFVAKVSAGIIYIFIFIFISQNLGLEYPEHGWNFIITRQLIRVSLPRSLQGGYQSLITFPFNALVLTFGTEAAAAYHIGRRIQQQIMAPLQRSYGTVTTIMTGQKLGEEKPEVSRHITRSLVWLTIITIGSIGLILFILAPQLVGLFSEDTAVINFGISFLRTLSLGAPILTVCHIYSGLLTSAGNTKTPFYGLVINQTIFKLGLSSLLSLPLGFGIFGIFIGIIFDYIGQLIWVLREFLSLNWVEQAREMIDERQ